MQNSIECPSCKSMKVFLCSGGYYICNECDWFSRKGEYDAEKERRDLEADEQE